MADFTSPGTAQELDLADAERWKIVVQHELFEVLAEQCIDSLLVRRGAQGCHHQRLRLAAGKQRRAMRARQHFDFAGDRPDVF